ncbi:hypothetical protein PFTANZ_06229 [Plasmodium falciparum Tanzania (2000708)]|uniref:Erythrocyte membrane protein 1 n=2 Tax=Plasmodium falciparum TaxID=5833 RepID=A0A024VYQ7_PLAFA|nr:hypothetical protein PFTANZ_06229 [Plasmodium falciparum Tanzania (2000708)]
MIYWEMYIGDIVRGRDMFKPNQEDKVQEGLKVVFRKINDGLKKSRINDYDRDGPEYYKLREDWWALNRDQVWRALTCSAQNPEQYFIQSEDGTKSFSEQKCGHYENNILTNLDYAPQFLRWFEEWAEEFCRIRKIKLGKIKGSCRNNSESLYCSHNGYDCTKSFGKLRKFCRASKCTKCSNECLGYENWIKDKKIEFEKQVKKYEREINGYTSAQGDSNKKIYKGYNDKFYENLKGQYGKISLFLNLLKEGKYCNGQVKEEKSVDFNSSVDNTFSRSKYCQVCPDCGVECTNGQCKEKTDVDGNCGKPPIYTIPTDVTPTDINVLYSGYKRDDISEKLETFCTDTTNNKSKNNETWKCYYKDSYDNKNSKCIKQSDENIKNILIINLDTFFDFWVTSFLNDTIDWKYELNTCMNFTNTTKCNNNCNKNCKCFEQWVNIKKTEWKNVTEYFFKHDEISKKKYCEILKDIFENYYVEVIEKVYKEDKKWKEIMGEIKKNKINCSNLKNGIINSQGAVERLLQYLKENVTTCIDNNSKDSCETFTNRTPNPCVNNTTSNKPTKSVKQLAEHMQTKANETMLENSRNGNENGESVLKGDIKNAKFKNGAKPSQLTDACEIKKEHSNDSRRRRRRGDYNGPCTGKGNRFSIGEMWSHGNFVTEKHKDVYMPPRREHICTSNLEKLDVDSVIKNANDHVNDTFLVDVLLAAKEEADYIKKTYEGNNDVKYKDKNGLEGDQVTTCRAIKSSFADLGDIIRGRDMWEHSDQTQLQRHLKEIFGKIKEEIKKKHPGIKEIYKEDTPYTKLREDWWEANRAKVWEAMQCPTSPSSPPRGNNTICSDTTPYDDYVPQRLRWMTEWAEWYCKVQKEAYDKLVGKCNGCMSKGDGKCTQGNGECANCATKCKQYAQNVKKWEDQWKAISNKYDELYKKALPSDAADSKNGPKSTGDKDQYVIEFLKQLQQQNDVHTTSGDKSDVYATAEGYVHQETTMDCEKQTQFCKNKNGVKPSNGREDNEYTFRNYPNGYDDACVCEKNKKPAPVPKKQEEEAACDIVKGILRGKTENNIIGNCKGKYKNGKSKYPLWNCDSEIDHTHTGACMPPRRQKLCIKNLTKSISAKEDLRTKFITCAAIETFFSWYYYKSKNGNVQTQLQNGTIPLEFLRSMFYTFGDYRDILFGTDISKNNGNIREVNQNINNLFKDKKGQENVQDNSERVSWWEKNKRDIWQGMLCALTHTLNKRSGENFRKKLNSNYEYDKLIPSLEEFSSRPPFLRWFTEWSDEFCSERKKKEKEVEKECKKDYDGCEEKNNSGSCVNACKAYNQYITDKKTQYDKQKKKFEAEKTSGKAGYKNYSKTEAPEYLQKECLNSACNCMDKVHTISNYWEQPHTTYDDENFQKKCDCPPSPCNIVDSILGDKTSPSYAEGCRHKYTTRYVGWECNSGNEDGLCIPPRRQRLFVQKLHDLKGDATQVQLRDAFIKCAAVETFFAWHEFKKEKEREDKEKKERDGNAGFLEGNEQVANNSDHPQNILKTGKIHEEFKLQMFYTLADYRDICLGNKLGNTDDTKNISNTVTSILKNEKNGVKPLTAEIWWGKNAKDIWEGMLCAISYNTETKEINQEVRDKLTNNNNNSTYKYEKVTFGDNQNTTFSKFAESSPYFRWFTEWGDEFCRKKKIKIENIEKDCRVEKGENHCDDDGFDCEEIGPNENKIFDTFNCPSCAKSCRSYKYWINRKRNEFKKQSEKYQNKITDAKNNFNSIYDNEFVKEHPKNYTSVDSFLKILKEGKCYNSTGNSIIDFNNPDKTFKHTEYCAPCPVIGVKCRKDVCNDDTVNTCKDKKITIQNIEKMENHIDVQMLVSDNSKNGFPHDLYFYKDKGVFEGIRKDEWTCGYVCGYDVCKPKKDNGDINDKEYVPIRVLFKRWVEHFLKDYNKINDKISYCMKNDEVSKCINGCKDKCECVDKWIDHKRKEWERVRDRYLKPYNMDDATKSFSVRTFLETLDPQTEVRKAIKPFTNLINFEDSNKCMDSITSKKKDCENNDVITILINKLKNEISDCQSKHKVIPGKECPQQSPSTTDTPQNDNENDTLLDTPSGFPPPFCNVPANPCGKPDATNVVNVEEVAKEIQEQRHKEMLERSGKKDDSVLKGDIKNAKFRNSRSGKNLTNVCDIKKEYTNDKRGNPTGGACEGKDGNNGGERMKIGTIWQTKNDLQITDPYLFLPPRREHICTSNLEKIHVSSVTDSSNINDTFLVDVLLAAKMDAEKIKDLYKIQNKISILSEENDKATVCRAMKYSFADLGDIIRGKDLWEHKDFKDLQTNLVTIFGKIKEELKSKLNGKYKDDTDNKQLRCDWWEANRDQVWEAMQCKTTIPPVTTSCDTTTVTPLDDYIPQRLRWMIEWAEWYCKIQKKEYEELERKCGECRSGKCGREEKCKECKEKCQDYEKKIEPWKQQWERIKEKYDKLYEQADSADSSNGVDENEKTLLKFLKKVKQQNSANNIYATAEGYVHQELPNIGCNTQNIFCEKNCDGKVNDKYVFRKYPYDHEKACNCNENKKQEPKIEQPCTIVEEILKDKGEKHDTHNCKEKQNVVWQCADAKLGQDEGLCMPPRRQNLCVHYLKELKVNDKEDKLREAFIKCAAKEIHLLWKKYKEDKQNEISTEEVPSPNVEAQNQLNSGIIPEEFKRQMFYTFGDYKYICLGKDIGSDVDEVNNNITALFQNGTQNPSGQNTDRQRNDFWGTYGKDIWEGMLCALEKSGGKKSVLKEKYNYSKVTFSGDPRSPKLDEFASRSPFLRWFTEWGEQFCRERIILLHILNGECQECTLMSEKTCNKSSTGCQKCSQACEQYQGWLETWKQLYNNQKENFLKNKNKYKDDPDVEKSKNAYEYLKTKLENIICNSGTTTFYCNCIDKMPSTDGSSEKMPPSLEYPPIEIEGKCDCQQKEATPVPKVPEVPKNSIEPGSTDETQEDEAEKPAETPASPDNGEESPEYVPEKKISVPPPKKPEVPPAKVPEVPKKTETPLACDEPSKPISDILSSTIPFGIAIALTSIVFLFLKKKPKSPVDLIRVLDIHKGDYGTPTPKSKNRYIPYRSGTYKGKTYIYMEGDSSGDEKYAFMSDTTDITSSESEYEEMDINDIYVPGSPKYKTLIEVVLEPSKSNGTPLSKGDPLGDDMVGTTIFTDEEWSELKHDFISQYVQREPLDIPQYDVSKELPMNIVGNVLDDGMDEKPFITSIHDRDLYSGEEISYNINMSTNSMDDPEYVSNNVYSGIDLINDTLSGNEHIDIYDEVLKRKENELFGTNYKKNISNNSVAKLTNSDPIMNQLDLLHKWLDRHRDMCEQWNNKEELLDKLNEQWNKDNDVGGDISTSNGNKTLNTNVSIEIDMDETKGKKEFRTITSHVHQKQPLGHYANVNYMNLPIMIMTKK